MVFVVFKSEMMFGSLRIQYLFLLITNLMMPRGGFASKVKAALESELVTMFGSVRM
jgi:hypothetical protein